MVMKAKPVPFHLETQLRRINPPESLGDMVFRKVLAVGEATFSLAASKAAAEKVAQEKADRLEAARLKFRQKKAEQLAEQKRQAEAQRQLEEQRQAEQQRQLEAEAQRRQLEEQRRQDEADGFQMAGRRGVIAAMTGQAVSPNAKKAVPTTDLAWYAGKESSPNRYDRSGGYARRKESSPNRYDRSGSGYSQRKESSPRRYASSGGGQSRRGTWQNRARQSNDGDMQIVCRTCQQTFVFSALQQADFERRGFNQPKVCQACRRDRRNKRD